ncbi:MAG TPA: nucleotide exchange factor GrpE [Armatimonadota bacterium]|jgi:molecular chaperone GrpE
MRKNVHEPDNVNPQTAADIDEALSPACAAQTGEQNDALDLHAALTQCQQELQEAKNAQLRAHADFDNFRKRMRAERDQEFSRGSERVLADLLPVVDDFERALAAVSESSTVESLTQGVDLIYRQMLGLLGRYGLAAMEVEGKPFDPKFHDAVARVVTDAQPEHTIIGEIQRGYTRNGEVFRPAKVAVSVTPEEPVAE